VIKQYIEQHARVKRGQTAWRLSPPPTSPGLGKALAAKPGRNSSAAAARYQIDHLIAV
jgi:hypothetical protein